MDANGNLRPGSTAIDGTTGLLHASQLTVSGGDVRFDVLSPGTNQDQVTVGGAVTFSGASTIGIGSFGSNGTYTLVSAPNAPITYTVLPTFVAPSATRTTFTPSFDTNSISVTLSLLNKSLTWTGASSNVWDITGATNWTDGSNPEQFFNLDTVSFTDAGTNTNVVLNAIVNPAAVIVDNSVATPYSISGTGSITGTTTTLTKSGGGKLILETDNSYDGLTTISQGTLQIGNGGTVGSLGTGDMQDDAVLAINRSDTVTIANNISGSGSLNQIGTGTTILTGSNSYGATVISNGTLQIGSGGTVGNLGTGDVTNNAALSIDRSDSITIGNNISGTGSLQQIGPGTTILSGVNTYSGGTIVSAGTLQGDTNSLQGDIADNSHVVFDQTFTGTYAGAISGSGSVTKSGSGTVIFSGPNIYTGGTTVSGGTLQGDTTSLQGAILNNAAVTFDQTTNGTYSGVLSGSGNVTKSGSGTVIFSGANTYTGGTLVSAGTLQGDTTSLQGDLTNNAIVVFSQNGNGTYSGILSGSGTVTKSGSGTVIFSGANTYSGGTTVTGGILQGSTTSLQGDILNNANVTFNQNFNGTYAGVLSGTGSLVKLGTGTTILSGANTYGGGTTVTAGTLQGDTTSLQGDIVDNAALTFSQNNNGTYSGSISGSGSVLKTGTGTVVFSGTNSYVGGTTVSAGGLQGTTDSLQGAILNNAAITFDQATNGTYSGVLSGSGNVTKSGSGTVIFSGANTYAGGTTITAGTLQGDTSSLQGDIVNNANIAFNQSTDGTYSSIISGSGNLTKIGTGTVTLSGANTYSGGTLVSGGTLQGTTTSLQGDIVNNANVIFNQTTSGMYTGTLSGNGSVTKIGSGTVTFSGVNTYSGGTTVSAAALQGTTSSLQGDIVNNASVIFNQAANGIYAGVLSGSGTVTKSGAGTVIFSGANTYSGGTTISGGTLQGTTTSLQGDMLDNSHVTFDQTAGGTYAGNISGTGGVTKSGSGTVIFSGVHSYAGGTVVSGGILQGDTSSLQGDIANNAAVTFDQTINGIYAGAISGAGTVTKSGSGTVVVSGTNSYSGGTTVSGGTLQGTTSSLQGDIDNTANVDFSQNTNGGYADAISGNGTVTKSGSGLVTFSGTNTYTGLTAVNAGTLVIDGTTTSSATIAAGATLSGHGTINGNIVNSGAVAPGGTSTINKLRVNGDYTSNTGSALQVQVNAAGAVPGTNNSLLEVQGNVNLAGTVDVSAASGSYTPGTPYTFLTYTGTKSGVFDSITDNLPLLDAQLIYAAGGVKFELLRNSVDYSSLAHTSNQRQIAGYLDANAAMASGDLATVLNQLNTLTASQARTAMNQMTGQVYGSFAQLGVQNTTQIYLLLNRRLSGQSFGAMADPLSADDSASNFSINSNPQSSDIVMCSYDPEAHELSFARACDQPTWNGWITGYGWGGDVLGDGNASGGLYNIGGTVFAIERRLNDSAALGFFGSYADLNLSLADVHQTTTGNDFQFGSYVPRLRRCGVLLVGRLGGFRQLHGQPPDSVRPHRSCGARRCGRLAGLNLAGKRIAARYRRLPGATPGGIAVRLSAPKQFYGKRREFSESGCRRHRYQRFAQCRRCLCFPAIQFELRPVDFSRNSRAVVARILAAGNVVEFHVRRHRWFQLCHTRRRLWSRLGRLGHRSEMAD